MKKYVPSVSSNDDAFLEQLYTAFDVDNNKAIDFSEFVDGLSVFMKGSPEEKLSCRAIVFYCVGIKLTL